MLCLDQKCPEILISVRVTGLAPSTLYQYQCKGESEASSIAVAFLSRLPISLTIMSADTQSPASFSVYFALDIALSQSRVVFQLKLPN